MSAVDAPQSGVATAFRAEFYEYGLLTVESGKHSEHFVRNAVWTGAYYYTDRVFCPDCCPDHFSGFCRRRAMGKSV
jgi:hypothetical protein